VRYPWAKAIVVGASSGMGARVAEMLAESGCAVALIARRAGELEALACRINERAGRSLALPIPHDVTDYDGVPAVFQQACAALGGLEAIFYTAGVMPRVGEEEYDHAKDRRIVEVNLLGAMAWLNEAALRFGRERQGTIVAVSSVAGDRGRRGNPAYCASKAGLDAYMEAVRNRVARYGVRVVTVKPGPVETPMTQGLGRLPMMVSVDVAARGILAAAARGRGEAYVPGKWRIVMWIIRHIPSPLFRRMNV